MKTNIKTFLPIFNGFYETLLGDIIDDCTDYAIEDYNEDNGTELSYDSFNFDYRGLQNEISRDCVSIIEGKINELIKCSLVFEKLVSPKFYNYSNDSINIAIEGLNKKDFLKLAAENKDYLSYCIKSNYTSCDGFISSYSNDVKEWITKLTNDFYNCRHEIGAILGFLLIEIIEFDHWDLYDEITANNQYQVNFTISNH